MEDISCYISAVLEEESNFLNVISIFTKEEEKYSYSSKTNYLH